MSEQLKDYYNSHADEYLSLEANDGLVFQKLLQQPEVEKKFWNKKVGSILDIGCGTGYYLKYFSQLAHQVVWMDQSEKMLEKSMEIHDYQNIDYIQWNFLEYDFKWKKFDTLFASFVLNYYSQEELNKFFAHAKKCINDNGKILVTVLHPFRINWCKNQNWYEISNYFWDKKYCADFLDKNNPLELYSHTFEDLSVSAWNNDFEISWLVEPKLEKSEWIDKDFFQFYSQNPSILIIEYVLSNKNYA